MSVKKHARTKSILRAIGNENRLLLIRCLSKPQSVTELLKRCSLSQSALSQHLKILKDCGVATCEKRGKLQIYFVKEKRLLEIVKKIVEIK